VRIFDNIKQACYISKWNTLERSTTGTNCVNISFANEQKKKKFFKMTSRILSTQKQGWGFVKFFSLEKGSTDDKKMFEKLWSVLFETTGLHTTQ
jgi:hypothetical protein